VGVLWITGGLMWEIPHCEATPAFFVMNIGPRVQILTIFENQPAKKVSDYKHKNIFEAWQTLWFQRDS